MNRKETGGLFDNEWLELKSHPFENLYSTLPNLRGNKEIEDLQDWYEERVNSKSALGRERVGLTDGRQWSYESTESVELKDAQIEAILRPDGQFYKFLGMKVTKYDHDGEIIFEWLQPVKKAMEQELTLDLLGESKTLPFNGILAAITDNEGNILMAADQESTAESPNQLIVKLAVQASAGKIAKMMGTDTEPPQPNADKQLAQLLEIYGTDIFGLLDMAEVKLLPPVEDTNSDIKHNLLLVLPSLDSSDELHQKLIETGERKWISKVQQSALGLTGISNSHALAALQMVGSYSILKEE